MANLSKNAQTAMRKSLMAQGAIRSNEPGEVLETRQRISDRTTSRLNAILDRRSTFRTAPVPEKK